MNVFRRELGRIKYLLLNDLPYRRPASRVPGMRQALFDLVPRLPPLSGPGSGEIEVHMLCGGRDAAMGIFASWSLFRFLEGRGQLYIHSDGTLTEDIIARWSAVVPGIIVVPKDDADQRVAETLGTKTRLLCPWRRKVSMSEQVIDYHLYGNARKIISFDSDILAFQRPEELINWVLSDSPAFVWCNDFQNAYSAPRSLFREVLDLELPERLNAGLIVAPRFDLDTFAEIDEAMEAMERDGRIDIHHYWSPQTYYAVLAARRGLMKTLPETYETHHGKTRRDARVRHYVGAPQIRYRYFAEGIPRLLGKT